MVTTARWQRDFVNQHADYKNDAVVSEKIAYDLLVECNLVATGKKLAPTLLGDAIIKVRASESTIQPPTALAGMHSVIV